MNKFFSGLYGGACYFAFLCSFLYLAGFLSGWCVPKCVDTGEAAPLRSAFLVNLGLLTLFGIQHSVMARKSFKAKFTRFFPETIERSTFVLATSLVLIVMYAYWQAIPQAVWTVEHPALRFVIHLLFVAGLGIVLLSSFLIDHFELFGLQQVYDFGQGRPISEHQFKTPFLYKIVRHPMMLGMLIAFWARPDMSVGHLMLSIGMSVYIWIGIYFEERDLRRSFGEQYRSYQKRVPKLLPIPMGMGDAGETKSGQPASVQ